ncbi:MAG: protein kinase, partial [Pyrinomonadaceae bacterium]|nr:protein kinase [Pyrinomonadaceae bacterium]
MSCSDFGCLDYGFIESYTAFINPNFKIRNLKSYMVGSTFLHYKILEKLGAGGQGTVYKALDTRLGRTVVIKILPRELTIKTANVKRFEREAQLCSQLDHSNICTIFDFGESEGLHYIAMQYIEGKTVRDLVAGKPLEMNSALSIGVQVCDGLAAAHARGIIHRDIKAGNVMVMPSGQTKILDFGLAKLQEDEALNSSIDRTDLTEIGIPYGTATYAAPEQARGDKVDHRADIFSTGVLLYELLAGTWPFRGKTVVEVRYAVLHGQPQPLAEIRNEPIIPNLQAILDKAMAKEPSQRYQKISGFHDDLRKVWQEFSGVSAAQTFVPNHLAQLNKNRVSRAWGWITGKKSDNSSTSAPRFTPSFAPSNSFPPVVQTSQDISITSFSDSDKKSIAILPFQNLSRDPNSQFYEFSLADAVTTELAQLRSLVVRPSSVIAKYQGKEIDARQAGREMQVNAVLSASFMRAGEKMRVTAQLLDVATGDILWSDRIDANADDIFALQDLIAQRVLKGLELELSSKEQEKLGQRPTDKNDAYEEYLRGRDNFGRFVFRTLSLTDFDSAIDNFKRALDLDDNFAMAYSALGACYANRVFKGIGDGEDYNRAEAAFSKAIALNPNIVEARVLMLFIYLSRGEKKKARAEIAQLQNEFPNDASLYFVKAGIHRLDGEYEKALRSWERLERLDPAARVVASYNKARIYAYQGDYAKAMRELDFGASIEPNHPLIKIFRARIMFYEGEVETSTAMMREVLDNNPHLEGTRPILAISLAQLGKFDEARLQLTPKALQSAQADHDMA